MEELGKALELLKSILGALPKRSKKAELVLKIQPQDLTPCQVRFLREGRGLPWQRQVGIHCNFAGRIHLFGVEEPKKDPPKIGPPKKNPPKRLR